MLNPIRVRRSVFVRASPEAVWRLFENPDSATALLPNGATVELLTDRFDQVGSSWRVVSNAGGERAEVVNEVVEVDPARLQVPRSSSDRMEGTSRAPLRPQADGTLLEIEGTTHFPPGIGRLPDQLLAAIVGPIATGRSLKQMKRLIEEGSG